MESVSECFAPCVAVGSLRDACVSSQCAPGTWPPLKQRPCDPMKHNNEKRTAAPAATCWQREAPGACVRIELSPRETYLFPYQHFVSASLKLGDDQSETLHLAFSSHDVEITGRNLRGLLSALQEFAVKWL